MNPHGTIELKNYMELPSSLLRFYQYAESLLTNSAAIEAIQNSESKRFLKSFDDLNLKEYFLPKADGIPTFEGHLQDSIPKQVEKDINDGLPSLRRQLLVTVHSLFENFLCHVVRVYLHTFPEILKGSQRSLSYRDIVVLRKNEKIFDHIVEKEIREFSFLSFEKKKRFLSKRLYLRNEKMIWIDDGEELWKKIDVTRQDIIHGDTLPAVSYEFLLKAVNYVQRAMLAICLNAQVGQGIPFEWGPMSQAVRKRVPAKLKGNIHRS